MPITIPIVNSVLWLISHKSSVISLAKLVYHPNSHPFVEHPTTLVGKTIKQRFQDESGDPESCVGTVIDYRGTDKTRAHCIE